MKQNLITIIFALVAANINAQTTSDPSWLPGSWGVRLIVEGGVELDKTLDSNTEAFGDLDFGKTDISTYTSKSGKR